MNRINNSVNLIGNLGMETTEFPNPVFIGDTLRVQTEIVDKRESKSKPDRGIVKYQFQIKKVNEEMVQQGIKVLMTRSRSS